MGRPLTRVSDTASSPFGVPGVQSIWRAIETPNPFTDLLRGENGAQGRN